MTIIRIPKKFTKISRTCSSWIWTPLIFGFFEKAEDEKSISRCCSLEFESSKFDQIWGMGWVTRLRLSVRRLFMKSWPQRHVRPSGDMFDAENGLHQRLPTTFFFIDQHSWDEIFCITWRQTEALNSTQSRLRAPKIINLISFYVQNKPSLKWEKLVY